jgi:serine phosphatase RsbU (regulator of sigma subunit)
MKLMPTGPGGDQKVLIVDDELANLQKLHRTLMGRYPVLAARTAGEALRFLENDPAISVIITDQRMPDMTGTDLLRHSLSTHPQAIRIILTGFTDADVLMDAINSCKVFRYLVKPWEPADLLVTVERGMETYRLTIENERFRRELIRRERLARELEIARDIQRYILPSSFPPLEGYEMAVEYHPAAEVGGDLYDFDYSPETGTLQLVVGDVSGKSIPAALYGAVFSGQLRARFTHLTSPANAMSAMNANLLERAAGNNYIAVAFVRLELASGSLAFSNGGMPYPYLVHKGAVRRLELPGLPLGLLPDVEYEQVCARLEPGDILVVASDGCTEAENGTGEPFDEIRFVDAASRHCEEDVASLLRSLYREICAFSEPLEAQDDITIVGIRRTSE